MARRRRRDEPTQHDAWAIPYGDLVTLLLACFVVLYAISSVNAGKYRVLSDALSTAFRGAPPPVDRAEPGPRVRASAPAGGPAAGTAPQGASPAGEVPRVAATPLLRIAKSVEQAVPSLVLQDQVIVRVYPDRVEVEIRNDLLFASGSARLSPAAEQVIVMIAGSLVAVPNPLRVEGHTDNVPISRPAFPSYWELSAARSASVVRVMVRAGIPPERLAVLGLGEFRPVALNDTPEGRNANRRVILVILDPERAPVTGTTGEGG
jgi:chemotaxis protein MotB